MRLLATISLLAVGGFILYNEYAKKNKPKIIVRKKLAGNTNFNAMTIPPFGIFIDEKQKDNKALLDHEMVHWKQYQELGLLKYYGKYMSETSDGGYDNSAMEKEARTNESGYCQDNYTECVRNGVAQTVHNPNFRR